MEIGIDVDRTGDVEKSEWPRARCLALAVIIDRKTMGSFEWL